jgi:hypothetical protein
VNVQVPNYGYWESVTAGHQITALNAAYDYINKPEFETIRGYDPSIQIKLDETKFGIFRTDAQKEHLLRSRSPDDYNWRTKVLTEEANDAKRIQQNTGMAFVGMVADVDIAVGYGITKVANLAKLEKGGRVAAHVTGNAAATAGFMSAGNQVRPMTTAEIIEYTLAVAAGSALGEVLRTPSKVLDTHEPIPPTVVTGRNAAGINTADNAVVVDTAVKEVPTIEVEVPFDINKTGGSLNHDTTNWPYKTYAIKEGVDVRVTNVVNRWGEPEIIVHKDNKVIGVLSYGSDGIQHPDVMVVEGYRRKGVATLMYDIAQDLGGVIPALDNPSAVRTNMGQPFRENYVYKPRKE